MAWVRLDDGYPEHPKVDRVGPLAAWLNVCAWAYCARNLTDGFVPSERVPRLAQVKNAGALAGLLVEANLWEVVEGGYRVHDFLAYNPSREAVLKDRAATAKRVAGWRSKQGSNGVTPTVSNGMTNGVSTVVGNGVSTPPPVPIPSPVRPGVTKTRDVPPSATTSLSPQGAAAAFSSDDRARINSISETLAPFAISLDPKAWRKVLDDYGQLDLEAEAFKQADWMRRHRIKACSTSRYLNWLDKARDDRDARHIADQFETTRTTGCPGCGKANWDTSMGPLCLQCAKRDAPVEASRSRPSSLEVA